MGAQVHHEHRPPLLVRPASRAELPPTPRARLCPLCSTAPASALAAPVPTAPSRKQLESATADVEALRADLRVMKAEAEEPLRKALLQVSAARGKALRQGAAGCGTAARHGLSPPRLPVLTWQVEQLDEATKNNKDLRATLEVAEATAAAATAELLQTRSGLIKLQTSRAMRTHRLRGGLLQARGCDGPYAALGSRQPGRDAGVHKPSVRSRLPSSPRRRAATCGPHGRRARRRSWSCCERRRRRPRWRRMRKSCSGSWRA